MKRSLLLLMMPIAILAVESKAMANNSRPVIAELNESITVLKTQSDVFWKCCKIDWSSGCAQPSVKTKQECEKFIALRNSTKALIAKVESNSPAQNQAVQHSLLQLKGSADGDWLYHDLSGRPIGASGDDRKRLDKRLDILACPQQQDLILTHH